MSTYEIGALPALRLACLQTEVDDESQIGDAARALVLDLRQLLAAQNLTGSDVVLTYIGPPGDAPITVSAGVQVVAGDGGLSDLTLVDVDEEERGASVVHDGQRGDVGAAWDALDAALGEEGLRTTGTYRQLVPADGPTVLQAPVEPVPGEGAPTE